MSPSNKRSREDALLSSSSSSSSPSKRSKTESTTLSPKDLSGLFTNVLPPSVASTPSRSLTSRMLTKSSTEPNILMSPTQCKDVNTGSPRSKRLGHTMSLPIMSLSPPQTEISRPRLSPSPSSRSKTNVRTYAHVRSFLMPLPLKSSKKETDKDSDDTEEDNGENFESKESYSTLRTRLGVDHSEDNPFHVSGLNNDLSTITELRSKGEARRFLDEVGYLFEGLEAGVAAGVRRSSAFEIITNMCNHEFMRKANATDFTSHVWDALVVHHPDKVLDFYIAVFIALIARDKRDIDNLCRKPGFFEIISRLIKYPKEKDAILITDTRSLKSVFTKTELASLGNLRQTIIKKSGTLPSDVSPSLRNLVAHTLTQISISAIPSDLLFLTQQHLLDELGHLQTDIEAYTSDKDGYTPKADLYYIRKYLNLFDSTLTARRIDDPLQEGLATIQKPLVSKLVMLYGTIQCTDERFSTLHGCDEELLRILINLSNLNSSWATLVSKEPMFIRRIVYEISTVTKIERLSTNNEISEGNNADKQCLALALLSNLVLTSVEIKDPLRETYINQKCMQNLGCILQCECSSQTSALQILTALFVKLRVKSESENFLFFQVHVAALLCLLSIDHPLNRTLIMKDLKKENALLGSNGLKESILSFEKFYSTDAGSDSQDSTGPVDIQMQEQIKEACRSLCSL